MQQPSSDADLNYFVCTLGQAAAINKENPHSFKTINDFVDRQARQYPTHPAVGFPVSRKDRNEEWGQEVYTFEELRLISHSTILDVAESRFVPRLDGHRTVALLCPSSMKFLVNWLALMRTGYSVLLVAPQCQPSAIVHLCKVCKVQTLYFDSIYHELAKAAHDSMGSLSGDWELHLEPLIDLDQKRSSKAPGAAISKDHLFDGFRSWPVSENDIAYLHHTSGTSTGLPKPIPQTHHGAVGVLPTFTRGSEQATFSTTPLYHGGVADCFRAWTSGAMIWLFPGADIPVTAANVIRSLSCIKKSSETHHTPKVAYFSSVPYVLQMMMAEDEGRHHLKAMALVGVGGAALPANAGNEMVQQGINLLSRFGSAECGFLMSSHRDYASDKEWEYLRSNASPHLKFERQENSLAELIILRTWPHMTQSNREDGSYATSDLFAPHSKMSNAWKYHSRADSQLTLITGKKFDPAPLEAAISTSSLVGDVLIFGNGMQYPGALLFRSSASIDMTKEDILNALWPLIEELNDGSQRHTRLSKTMLVVMAKNNPGPQKSSKGTIMRGQAEKLYAKDISRAYEGCQQSSTESLSNGNLVTFVPDDEVPSTILKIIKGVTNTQESIPEDADLFSRGVDSVACMQIRASLHSKLLPHNASSLPLNVVYDCGSIKTLSNYIISFRKGQAIEKEDEIKLMYSLAKDHSVFTELFKPSSTPNESHLNYACHPSNGEIVILTGATGALGAHILSLLCSSSKVSKIHCLVRAASQTAANERVSKSLFARKRSCLDLTSKIQCHPCKLSSPTLGLPEALYSDFAAHTTIIIHAAWAVNFSTRLSSFARDHIAGVQNLINLALASLKPSPPRLVFCSSTASVLGPHRISPITESVSHDPLSASPLGYSRSKWVAEAICEHAHLKTRMRDRIDVLRIGQLCGDTENGVWNVTEAWPLMLSCVKATKCLPDLKDEVLGWLPVDIAAQAVLSVALPNTVNALDAPEQQLPVYHILNPSTQPTWSDLLTWLKKLSPGFDVVPPTDWVKQLEKLKGENADHPAKRLLGLWKEAYGIGKEKEQDEGKVALEMCRTKQAVGLMRTVKPIDEVQFQKMWRWIEQEMLKNIDRAIQD